MIVDRIAIDDRDIHVDLHARVRAAAERETILRYILPRSIAPTSIDGSPFIPAMLLRCMRTGEPLTIDGPVSPRLLEAVDGVMEFYSASWPGFVRPVRVRATQQTPPPPAKAGLALFFTRGVDSWHTLLNALQAGEDPRLLYVPDLDTWYDDEGRALAAKATARTAEDLGRSLEVIRTNLRWFTEPMAHFGYYHGAILASVALAAGFAEARINSHRSHGEQSYEPSHDAGSGPLLDPLFSTETTSIVHWGAHATRLEKVREIARHPLAVRNIKVCYEENIQWNCGACRKCLLTMLELHVTGALPAAADAFERELDPRLVARIVLPDGNAHNKYLELLPAFGDSRTDVRLERAVRKLLLRSSLRRIRGHVRAMTGGRRG